MIADWEISGGVKSVDKNNGTTTIWLQRFPDFMTTPITSSMPKWLLQPDTGFRTSIPGKCVRDKNLSDVTWGQFHPMEWEYMTEEELFDSLTEFFYPPENNKEKIYSEDDWPPFLDWLGHA